MNTISRLATAVYRWWRGLQKARSKDADAVYNCAVAQEPAGWLVIEMEWADLLDFLKSRPNFNSLPDDVVKADLDFSHTTVDPDLLRLNPSLRIRKGTVSEVVPINILGPVEDRVYFLSVKKLILAHLERQFRFNLVTWPLANALPLLLGGGLLGVWGFFDGWQLSKSDDFFTVVALAVSFTALAFVIWRLIVQESDKRHDSLCRRLEHELMAHSTTQMSNNVEKLLKFLQDRISTGTPSTPRAGSTPGSR